MKSKPLHLAGMLICLLVVMLIVGGMRVIKEPQEAAIAAIESFGGQVSLANSEARKQLEAQGGEPADITRVCIPHKWTGGAEGLTHLQSIEGLTELWLSGVAIDELHLANLPDLKRIVFNMSYFDEDLGVQVFTPPLPIKTVRLHDLQSLEQLDLTSTTAEALALVGGSESTIAERFPDGCGE